MLEISTAIKRPQVKIDDTVYELKALDEMNLAYFGKLQRRGKEITEIAEKDKVSYGEIDAKINQLLDDIFVCSKKEIKAIQKKVPLNQKMEIINFFLRETKLRAETKKKKTTNLSQDSSGSTADQSKNG